MGKLIVESFLTLDGVVDRTWEWVGPYYSEEQKNHSIEGLQKVDLFLLGRKTYEVFSSKWPGLQGDKYFDLINGLPKIVASNTLKEATWKARIISGDVAAEIGHLKQSGKTILKYGLGELDQTLLANGLIDELRFAIIPVAMRYTKHAFEKIDLTGIDLRLIDTKTFGNGVTLLTYVPVKRIT